MTKFGNKDFIKLTKEQIKKKQKVKLNTKKIFVSLKSSTGVTLTDAEKINTIIKHYGKTALALQALNETKVFFANCENPSQFLVNVYQEIFALLYEEEVEIRNKLKEVVKFLCSKFDSSALISALPTVIISICGGLTHVIKNVRFTTLEVFATILEKIGNAITEYFPKVFPLLLSLITEKSFFDTVTAEYTKSSKDSARSSRSRSLFETGLYILRCLALQIPFSSNASTSVRYFPKRKAEQLSQSSRSLVLEGSLVWLSQVNVQTNTTSKQSIETLVELFLQQLQFICVNLIVVHGSFVSNPLIGVLNQIFRLIFELKEKYHFHSKAVISFIPSLTNSFPFSFKDTDSHQPQGNSKKETVQSKEEGQEQEQNALEIFNLEICRLFLEFPTPESSTMAIEYLKRCLERVEIDYLLEQFQTKGQLSSLNDELKFYELLFLNLSIALQQNLLQNEVLEMSKKLVKLVTELKEFTLRNQFYIEKDTEEEDGKHRFSKSVTENISIFAQSLSSCFQEIMSSQLRTFSMASQSNFSESNSSSSSTILQLQSTQKEIFSSIHTLSSILVILLKLNLHSDCNSILTLLKELYVRWDFNVTLVNHSNLSLENKELNSQIQSRISEWERNFFHQSENRKILQNFVENLEFIFIQQIVLPNRLPETLTLTTIHQLMYLPLTIFSKILSLPCSSISFLSAMASHRNAVLVDSFLYIVSSRLQNMSGNYGSLDGTLREELRAIVNTQHRFFSGCEGI